MTDRNDKNASTVSRRDALKLGLAAGVGFTLFGMSARIVMAQEGQVLKAINPAF